MKKYKITIALLLLTNVLTFVYYHNYLNNSELLRQRFENPYPFVDVSRNFIPQEDFVVNLQPLRESLRAIAEEYGGEQKVSYYVEFLNTGANISYNQEARFYPASLIKMPIAMAAMKKIQDGEWQYDSQLVLFPEDIEERYGNLHNDPVGSRYSIERLLEEVLINSDNTAYKILLRNLGSGEINQYLEETGMETLFNNQFQITAKEYTRIMRSLYSSSYLQRQYSQKVLELLSHLRDDIYLDKGLPDDVTFSHKYGENFEGFIYGDSGIVYVPNRPYVITVLYQGTESDSQEYVDSFFEKVSKEAYEFFKEK